MSEPLTRDALLGSWSLIDTFETVDGQKTALKPLGARGYGFIHYLADGRMAVLMANGGRLPLSKGRYNSGLEETAESVKSFTAYGGTWTINGSDIVHHLEISIYENDRGTDYLRHAVLNGDQLTLLMPTWQSKHGTVQWGLVWQKLPATTLQPSMP